MLARNPATGRQPYSLFLTSMSRIRTFRGEGGKTRPEHFLKINRPSLVPNVLKIQKVFFFVAQDGNDIFG